MQNLHSVTTDLVLFVAVSVLKCVLKLLNDVFEAKQSTFLSTSEFGEDI